MWSPAIYCRHSDEATARAAATALGVDFPPSGRIPTGNQNYAMHAPMQAPWATPPILDGDGEIVVPGVAETGYWSMLRLNMEWSGYEATMDAIVASGARRELVDPPVEWARDP